MIELLEKPAFIIDQSFQIIGENSPGKKIRTNKKKKKCYQLFFHYTEPCPFCLIDNKKGKGRINGKRVIRNIPVEDNFCHLAQQVLEIDSGQKLAVEQVTPPETVMKPGEISAREQLVMLGALVQTIAHELGNPITGLNLTWQTLNRQIKQKEKITPEKIVQTSELLKKDIDKAANIIADIRNFSRPVHSSHQLIILKEALESSLESAIRGLKLRYTPKVLFEWGLSDTETLIGNRQKLEQAFTNLIKNSIEAFIDNMIAPEKSLLHLKASLKNNDTISIEIIDNAGGIPNTTLKKVFTPYFSTKEKHKGFGLGLYIAENILKEHGGTIGISSHRKTTTVTLYFKRNLNNDL